jgi:dipeptidyl aminopeptidase/acylaminoacyl peptidase
VWIFLLICVLAWQPGSGRAAEDSTPQQRRGRFGAAERGVYKARVTPHWFQDNTRFWYRNDLANDVKEFIVVEAEKGTRAPAFDHQKLADGLSKAAGREIKADHLPFSEIDFVEGKAIIQFEAFEKTWQCDLSSYQCAPKEEKASPAKTAAAEGSSPISNLAQLAPESGEDSPFATEDPPASQAQPAQSQGRPTNDRRRSGEPERARPSPDTKWSASVKDHNVYLHSDAEDKDYQLTHDGEEGNAYGRLEWAPDSKALVAWRIEPGARKEVFLIQSSPAGGGRATFRARPYDLPGDKLPLYEVSVFDVAKREQVKPEIERFEHGWETPRLHWNRDGFHFTYEKTDRGHQRFRVIEVDAHTGATRNVIDEKSQTFIWTAHTENLNLARVNWLEKTDEIVYASEQDGWRHLYLIDARTGKIQNQITKGEYVVRAIDRIDEENRQVWFRACGREAGQDPYFIQYYRVNFDGTGLAALTQGNGNHSVQFSPDRKYIVDTFSRVDGPPIHELRRISDCGLISQFEAADISELKATGWQPPEVFTAKGRDGKTDIWGIICRPRDFDPNKKYPVIEQIYAGPQGSYVPKSFSGVNRFASLTDLGFIVVQMDGMGTANRSKAFHDVCWKNLKDAGFEDRIAWMKAAAEKYSSLDLSRVGIYGNSAGGQNAAAAVLFHPEFYKAAVASCGCHDNRMDKASWNEQWMGYPVGPQYSECSNIDNAQRLRGKLFLIVGEMDDNVPPESTLRFVDALIKADKDFDLLVIPGAGHGMGGAYGQHRMQDFFVRNLLGVEPANRNGGG